MNEFERLINEPDRFKCYLGKYACPKCESDNTGTNVVASSGRWIKFYCHDCKESFRKSAIDTSPLSKRLSNAMDIFAEKTGENDD